MILHGLLHLIGFAKEWNIGPHQVSNRLMAVAGSGSRFAGVMWLVASVLFVTAAICFLLRRDWYWIPGALALIISQVLIFIYWSDAKYGTVLNMMIVVTVCVSAAAMQFKRTAMRDVDQLMKEAGGYEHVISEEQIATLPYPVQRWLRNANVAGKKTPNTLMLRQSGALRTKADGKWMPFHATQYFSVDPPAFVWIAEIKAAPLFCIAGRDSYKNGRGNMIIKPLYVMTAANSSGNEVDQGTLLRYMAEMAWFPQAALNRYVTWEGVNEREAKVTMTYGGITASGTYYFNEDGSVAGFEAKRYGEFEGVFRKELWSVSVKDHKSFGGITIGHISEVTWKLNEGDFTWMKLEVEEIIPTQR